MVQTFLQVIEEYKPTKDYGIIIRKQYAKCLSVLKKGGKIKAERILSKVW